MNSNILKIGHRGYMKYNENTIESFQSAIDEGFDIIEMDLQLCNCNRIIVIYHDRHIGGFPIKSLNINQLKLRKKDIITLSDFFNHFTKYKKLKLYFDLKGSEEIAVRLKNYLLTYNIDTTNIYIASFNINHIKILYPEIKANYGFISSSKYTISQYYELLKNIQFLAIDKGIIDNNIIQICRGLNKKIFVFTCENENDLSYIKLFNIDGIISNISLTNM